MLKKIIAHYSRNPGGYWFKRSIFGWGWIPVTWQGFIVTVASVASIAGGIYFSQVHDAPLLALVGILVGVALTFGFGYWKGEKACFMWGFDGKEK